MGLSNQTGLSDTLLENKKAVREFYDLAFGQRRPSDAAARCLAAPARSFGDGAASPQRYVASVTGWLDTMPRLRVNVLRIVAEGDLVVVHSNFTPAPDVRAMLVMDMFRLRDRKIVEHWAALQEVHEGRAALPVE